MADWDHLWTDPLRDVVGWTGMHAQPDSPKARVAATIIQARLAQEQILAAQETARAADASVSASRSLVRATRWLVIATWALAATAVVIAVVT